MDGCSLARQRSNSGMAERRVATQSSKVGASFRGREEAKNGPEMSEMGKVEEFEREKLFISLIHFLVCLRQCNGSSEL